MSDIIEWRDPPRPVRPGQRDWNEIVRQCRERPGQWALIAENVSVSYATTAKRNGLQPHCSTAGKANGMCDFYVRWVDAPTQDKEAEA